MLAIITGIKHKSVIKDTFFLKKISVMFYLLQCFCRTHQVGPSGFDQALEVSSAMMVSGIEHHHLGYMVGSKCLHVMILVLLLHEERAATDTQRLACFICFLSKNLTAYL